MNDISGSSPIYKGQMFSLEQFSNVKLRIVSDEPKRHESTNHSLKYIFIKILTTIYVVNAICIPKKNNNQERIDY